MKSTMALLSYLDVDIVIKRMFFLGIIFFDFPSCIFDIYVIL